MGSLGYMQFFQFCMTSCLVSCTAQIGCGLVSPFTGCKGSIVVVITPLIALMVDQKQNLMRMGISVDFVGEAQDSEEAIRSVVRGDVQLVYISPESMLNNKKFCNMLQTTETCIKNTWWH